MYAPGVLMYAVSTGKADYATAIPVHASDAQGIPTFTTDLSSSAQGSIASEDLYYGWGNATANLLCHKN